MFYVLAADVLDEAPQPRSAPLVPPTVTKAILGQGAFQLTVLAWMLSPGGAQLVGGDTATQYTLLFNTFVIMQLFNQVRGRREDKLMGVKRLGPVVPWADGKQVTLVGARGETCRFWTCLG